jgi:hypothetical protein
MGMHITTWPEYGEEWFNLHRVKFLYIKHKQLLYDRLNLSRFISLKGDDILIIGLYYFQVSMI